MAGTIVAAVQATPVFLDRAATVDKACRLIARAGAEGAGIVALPEAFVPTYPDWVWRVTPWREGDAWYGKLIDQAVDVPSPVTEELGRAARRARAYACVGVNERVAGTGTLYNTLLVFGPDGSLLLRHRKLMPTGGERLVWGQGDASTLRVIETPYGRLGALLCWENYMPLARYALYAQGLEILVSPTWDCGDVWHSTLRHIAKEGRTYVVGVAPVLCGADVPPDLPGREGVYGGKDDWMCPGASMIVDPKGEILAGPVRERETILYAEVDGARARASRYEFDPVGHYSRPDLFRLTIDTAPRPPVVDPAMFGGERQAQGTAPDARREAMEVPELFPAAADVLGRLGPGPEAFAELGGLLRRVAAGFDLATARGLQGLHGTGAAATILAQGADGSVLMLARFPAEAPTPVHNHNSWGVVCVIEGRDHHVAWRRLDDGSDPSRARLEVAEARDLGPGDVVWFDGPPQDIHSQQGIDGDAWELVYFGADPNRAPRAYFDPAAGTVRYAAAT